LNSAIIPLSGDYLVLTVDCMVSIYSESRRCLPINDTVCFLFVLPRRCLSIPVFRVVRSLS